MKRLFLDVDGVLCDWNKGCHLLHGLPYKDGVWPYKLGPEGWHFYKELGMTVLQLFKGMDREFWKNLDWCSDGKKILRICEAKVGRENICLLTDPWKGDGATDGRIDWIKQEMPYYWDHGQYLIGPCKKACAHQDAILVDDYEKNIIDWQGKDGIGLLVPRAYNSEYKIKHVAIEHIEMRLHKITGTSNE